MKKFLVMLCIAVVFCGCEKKEDSHSSSNSSISEVQQETIQKDPYSVRTDISETTVSVSATTSETSITENISDTTIQTTVTENTTTVNTVSETVRNDSEQQPDPLGGGAFSYDENGAVEFLQDPAESDDRLLISAGQAIFETACRTQWDFTVGCPYEIDINSTVQNGFGWTYYKITDENIKSLADIENDYYKVFSDRYPNEDLKMLYLEFEGSVYALNGQREMNIYYSVSRIKDIQSRTDNEIFFTVENQFEGTDTNPDEPYSQEETFSVVLDGDKIKAGQFRLPY